MSVASFARIFSHCVHCLFILLMVSFGMQKVLSLLRPPPFFFILGGGPNKVLLSFMSKTVLLMFYSKSFVVYGFTVS